MKWHKLLSLECLPEFVIGSDEVGTGALAGPIVVTAVVYPFTWTGMNHLKDSKKYTKKQKHLRGQIAEAIYHSALTFSQQYVQSEIIDKIGIRSAMLNAHRLAIKACLELFPESLVVVDGDFSIPGVKHISIPKADDLVPAVSAASVLGKEERDWWMSCHASKQYPEYGFEKHMGYGTQEHYAALWKHGPCAIHRRSYKPIEMLMNRRKGIL